MAYQVIDSINPDFVSIHNGFNFDLRHLASYSTDSDKLSNTFEERRLGNSGVGVFWRLTNGTTCLGTMYYVDRNSRADWSSLSLAKMGERFNLPPKLDPDTMALDTIKADDIMNMIIYNGRDADLHVCVAEELNMCERVCMFAGGSRSTSRDSIANNTRVITF